MTYEDAYKMLIKHGNITLANEDADTFFLMITRYAKTIKLETYVEYKPGYTKFTIIK
jgi:hypothetical protein